MARGGRLVHLAFLVSLVHLVEEQNKPDRPLMNPPSPHTMMDQATPQLEIFPRWGSPIDELIKQAFHRSMVFDRNRWERERRRV